MYQYVCLYKKMRFISSLQRDILLFYMDSKSNGDEDIKRIASHLEKLLYKLIRLGKADDDRCLKILKFGVEETTPPADLRRAVGHSTFVFVLLTLELCETTAAGEPISKALKLLQTVYQETVSKPEHKYSVIPIFITNATVGKVPDFLRPIKGISVTSLLTNGRRIEDIDPYDITYEDVDKYTLKKLSKLLKGRKDKIFDRQIEENAWKDESRV